MWAMFFVFGTMWFWLLIGVVCLILIAAVEYEKPGWATLSVIVTGLLLWLFGDVNVFALAKAHPLWALLGVAGYFVAGGFWSVVKWWFYVRDCREKYDERKASFLRAHGRPANGAIPDDLKRKWWCDFNGASESGMRSASTDELARIAEGIKNRIKPRVRDNKGRILTWMVYWPWSMFWTLLNDPVKRIFKYMYAKMRALYQKIVDRVYKGTEADFVPPVNLPPIAPPTDPADNTRSRQDARDTPPSSYRHNGLSDI